MLISKTCSYAIRAAIFLVESQEGRYVPIRKISDELGISFHFLTKILQMLTARNLLVSFRGPNGGISLARSAEEISILDIIDAIDGSALFNACLLGLEKCDEGTRCRMHESWAEERERLRDLFRSTTLRMISDGVDESILLDRDLPQSGPAGVDDAS